MKARSLELRNLAVHSVPRVDTITHGIAGALIGKALFGGEDLFAAKPVTRGRVIAWSAMLGAIFPDSDTFRDIFSRNPLLVLTWHRSITHSLLMLPLFALALAVLTLWFSRRRKWDCPSFTVVAAAYAVGILSHILLDLCNNFGTMIWSPLAWSRPAWDYLFIIDFTFSGILLLPQLLAGLYGEPEHLTRRATVLWFTSMATVLLVLRISQLAGYPISVLTAASAVAVLGILIFAPAIRRWGIRLSRATWCRAGLLTATAYIGMAIVAHHYALARVNEFAKFEQLEVRSLAALPWAPSLWKWDGLIHTPRGFYELRMDLSRPAPSFEPAAQNPIEYRYYPDAVDNALIHKARQLPDVQTFLWFARFPLTRFRNQGNTYRVEFSDLRFPAQAGRASPFTYCIQLDASGQVLSHGRTCQ